MYCPYCGQNFPNDKFWTTEQASYVKAFIDNKVEEIADDFIDKLARDFDDSFRGNDFISVTHSRTPRFRRTVTPFYKERKVDSELICPDCNTVFQVFGIFGYCPGCGSENMLVYDANLSVIKHELANSQDKQRALRHVYSDLVATFESFCQKLAKSVTPKTTRFQSLSETRRFFKEHLNVDILDGLSDNEHLLLRRFFQKRHVNEHAGGIINENYVAKIPQDKKLLNTKVQMSLEEFETAALLLRQILGTLSHHVNK